VNEANTRINKLKDSLDNYKDNDLKFKIQNIMNEIENDKQLSKQEFDKLRISYEQRENNLVDKYEYKINELERQIDKLKDDVQYALSEVQTKNESQNGFTVDNINMIKKTIKLEYDEKINDILQKHEQKLEDKDRE